MAFSAFAVTAPGLESLAAAELDSLGVAHATAEHGGIAFNATDAILARTQLNLRTVTRVIVRVAEFRAVSFAQLEHHAKMIKWASWLPLNGAARFRVTCRKSKLYHTDAVAERLERCFIAAVRGARVADARDDDSDDDGAQLFVVRLANDICTISADASGAPLYMRGYRQAVAKAPLRESLAAAMLIGAKWDPSTALYDPMCGSGTIVIEAALMARNIAPGIHRTFAAERWPPAKPAIWQRARATAAKNAQAGEGAPLIGSDRDEGAITAARANAERAGVSGDVAFHVAPVSAAAAPAPQGLLIANPPYGVRVGATDDLRNLYARLGQVARSAFPGWNVGLLSADRELERQMGLDLEEAWSSTNGGIPVRLLTSGTASVNKSAPKSRR